MPGVEALKLGASALISYRAAIETTGHNIANIATPGYSRQRVLLQPRLANRQVYGDIGGGVEVARIERVVSEFLDAQLRLAGSDTERWRVLERAYRTLEAFWNELGESDLGDSIGRFFAALNDVADNPENLPARTQAIEQARSAAGSIQQMRTLISDYRDRLDGEVPLLAQRVNELVAEIARLNSAIGETEARSHGRTVANDLRDTRSNRLRELSEIIGVTAHEDNNGMTSVVAGSRPLVLAGEYYAVTASRQAVGGVPVYILAFAEDGSPVQVDSGTLRGVYDARDEVLVNYAAWLDDFAASLIYRVNRLHATGVGLAPWRAMHGDNRVADATATLLALDGDYEPRNGLFAIQQGDLVLHVLEEASGADNVVRIQVSPTMPLAGSAGALLETLDAVDGISARMDSRNRLVIEADTGYGFYFSEDAAGVLPALGLGGLFAGYDAGTIAVHADLEGHPEYLAAAKTLAAGDNSNALALAALATTGRFLDTELGFEAAYTAMVGRLGSDALAAQDALTNQENILRLLENERQDVSGVSLDEEIANLMQYQRGYQAMAKFISVVDELLATLIEM